MKIKMYQIDAFTKKAFKGNPAAVCVLEEWVDADLMQQIATENNLAETAFVVKSGDEYEIRWFTPAVEVDLCGHATLASAYVLFSYYEKGNKVIEFYSHKSGPLTVEKLANGKLSMDFPSDELKEVKETINWEDSLGCVPEKTWKGKTDYLLIYPDQGTIESINPDITALNKVDCRGVIVSAPGDKVDFVSRFFGPQVGVNEDPVTGSAHTSLIPFWANHLMKNTLKAKQLSKRTGDLDCEFLGDRVKIAGYAAPYLIGEIEI